MAARSKTTPKKIADIERQAAALKLRKQGLTFEQIASELGWAGAQGAYHAVTTALARTLQEPADELRQLEAERLNDLLAAMWPKAMAGETWFVDRCLAIMDRRAKLLGLDAPARQTVTVYTKDVIDQAIEDLEAQLAENDPEQVAS